MSGSDALDLLSNNFGSSSDMLSGCCQSRSTPDNDLIFIRPSRVGSQINSPHSHIWCKIELLYNSRGHPTVASISSRLGVANPWLGPYHTSKQQTHHPPRTSHNGPTTRRYRQPHPGRAGRAKYSPPPTEKKKGPAPIDIRNQAKPSPRAASSFKPVFSVSAHNARSRSSRLRPLSLRPAHPAPPKSPRFPTVPTELPS